MEHWYAFRAYNTESIYGYGTKDEAEQYSDILNDGREINVYVTYELSDDEVASLQLDNRDDAVSLEDALAAHIGLR